jgi:hypothetical protein
VHDEPKKQAQILKTLATKEPTSKRIPAVMTHKEKTRKDPETIANALNDHFITIGTNETIPNIAEDRQQHQQQSDDAARLPQFNLKHTTITEVTKLLNKVNRNKTI